MRTSSQSKLEKTEDFREEYSDENISDDDVLSDDVLSDDLLDDLLTENSEVPYLTLSELQIHLSEPAQIKRRIRLNTGKVIQLVDEQNEIVDQGKNGKIVFAKLLQKNGISSSLIAVKKVYKTCEINSELDSFFWLNKLNNWNYFVKPFGIALEKCKKTSKPKLYIAMPYFKHGDGLKLKNLILSIDNFADKCDAMLLPMLCIVRALQKLHKCNLFHLDLSLKNFLITDIVSKNKVPLVEMALIDFGCALYTKKNLITPLLSNKIFYGNPFNYSLHRITSHLNSYRQLKRLRNQKKAELILSEDMYFPVREEDLFAYALAMTEALIGKNPIYDDQVFTSHNSDKDIKFFQTKLNMLFSLPEFINNSHPVIAVIKGLLTIDVKNQMKIEDVCTALKQGLLKMNQLASTTIQPQSEESKYNGESEMQFIVNNKMLLFQQPMNLEKNQEMIPTKTYDI